MIEKGSRVLVKSLGVRGWAVYENDRVWSVRLDRWVSGFRSWLCLTRDLELLGPPPPRPEGWACDGYSFKHGSCVDHGRGWDPDACWRDTVVESGAQYEAKL